MSHAEICPVCHGSGKIPPHDDGQTTAVPLPVTCHGCGGSGWVTIEDGRQVVGDCAMCGGTGTMAAGAKGFLSMIDCIDKGGGG